MSFIPTAKFFGYWDRLRSSFWFIPSTMAVAAIVLSFSLVQLDTALSTEVVGKWGWLYTSGPEGARSILSSIASSMITVAGLTFSITMLTLQLASSQFGPRLLRNFMRDPGNQVVLGTFIATFVYCLLVLRTVRGTEELSFVPHLSVAFGILLALASIAVLIYFIHHIATAIRIETLLAELADEIREAIDRLYPERLGEGPAPLNNRTDHHKVTADLVRDAHSLFANKCGYVQRVDLDALMSLATEHDLLLRTDARPGCFVTESDALLRIHPEHVSKEIGDALRSTFVIGQERTPEQDLEFSVRRIVEIAQRALSPGINDPTTAIYCIDRLSEALGCLAERDIPSPYRFDSNRCLRVVAEVVSLEDLACPALAAVARYGITDADVARRLIAALSNLQSADLTPAQNAIFAEMAKEIRRASDQEQPLKFDRLADA